MNDDRIGIGTTEKSFNEFIKTACLSEFEGCSCARPKNHFGLHKCGSVLNKCSPWNDEQSEQWWQEFKKEL